ncbi:hypothetical protein [Shrimp hemocyte iridescent virus]|uniref:MSV199 domain-containing protein n=2 Tax=Decapodiridovirus litopenaeus1 TaxID=3428192 RepID=A0A291B0V1_9VIRU|nr:hypothetical protein KM509_gp102 [Shrimp hemocyte iridescent virus]ATE87111.1 hypothetical protein [Shrimp hemocyte iridescent virus]
MLDKFWQCIGEEQSVILDGLIMNWLGYEHEHEGDRKAAFIKLLKAHNIKFEQINHKHQDFSKYPELVEEAKNLIPNVLSKKMWIVMGSRDFKRMVMCLRTKRAHEIREYYLCIEDLFKMYCEYTLHFQLRRERRRIEKKQCTIEKITEQMEKMRIEYEQGREEDRAEYRKAEKSRKKMEKEFKKADRERAAVRRERDAAAGERDQANVERDEARRERGAAAAERSQMRRERDRAQERYDQAEADRIQIMNDIQAVREVAAPYPQNAALVNRMAVIGMSPNYVYDDKDPAYYQNINAIAVRTQVKSFTKRLNQIKRAGNGTNADADVLVSFDSPNPISLMARLRESYSHLFRFESPVGIIFENERDIIDAVNEIHASRMEYPNQQ